ncbi:MAG: RHS repeat protein [Planctomycetes bacterium]|nr:RHS repeat protein [Planctomycetota bacterium]
MPHGCVTGLNTVTFTYDGLLRMFTRSDVINTVTYTYDADSNVTAVSDDLGSVSSATYDVLGRVLTSTDATSGATSYNFDREGNVRRVTNPEGFVSRTFYDPLDRPRETVVDRGNGPSAFFNATYEYDLNGNLTGKMEGVGVAVAGLPTRRTDYSYDARNNARSVVYPSLAGPGAGPAGRIAESYAYNANDNRTRQIRLDEAGRAVNETRSKYDERNRLAESFQVFLAPQPNPVSVPNAEEGLNTLLGAAGSAAGLAPGRSPSRNPRPPRQSVPVPRRSSPGS